MPDKEISQLTSSTAQGTDIVPIARPPFGAGSNYGVPVSSIAALVTTPTFATLSGGTSTAVLVVGSGGSLMVSGTGIVQATQIQNVIVSGTPTAGQVLTATSATAADWQTFSSGSLSSLSDVQVGIAAESDVLHYDVTSGDWVAAQIGWYNTPGTTTNYPSSLTGWTQEGSPNVTISGGFGNPPPSFQIPSGGIIGQSVAGFGNGYSIECDVNFSSITTNGSEVNIMFGMNGSGLGYALILQPWSGGTQWFMAKPGWASQGADTQFGAGFYTFAAGIWYRIKILVNAAGTGATWYVNGIQQGSGNFTVGPMSGSFIGLGTAYNGYSSNWFADNFSTTTASAEFWSSFRAISGGVSTVALTYFGLNKPVFQVPNLQVLGTVADSTNAVGTNGQILTSTGTGTVWQALATPLDNSPYAVAEMHADMLANNVGMYGIVQRWAANGASLTTTVDATATEKMLCQLTSAASTGAVLLFGLNQSFHRQYSLGNVKRFRARLGFPSVANARIWIGLSDWVNNAFPGPSTSAFDTDTPDMNLVGFRYSDGVDAKWQCVTQTSSASHTFTPETTSSHVDANVHLFEFYWNGTNVLFFIDGVLVGTQNTTTPAVGTLMDLTIVTDPKTAAAQSMDVDYFAIFQ